MVQSINPTQKNDETDGLPMPKRIWAVVSVGFALCMSVLDINRLTRNFLGVTICSFL